MRKVTTSAFLGTYLVRLPQADFSPAGSLRGATTRKTGGRLAPIAWNNRKITLAWVHRLESSGSYSRELRVTD